MNLDDLKDILKNESKATWDRLQETSLYNNLKDRFDSLSSLAQKTIVASVVVISILGLFSIPWSYYSTSAESVENFENQRQLIRDMLKVTRESGDTPDIPTVPPLDSLKTKINSLITATGLIENQLGSVEIVKEASNLIPDFFNKGLLKVTLNMLNLNQIIDLGYQLQTINNSLKLKDLIIEPSSEDARYYNVVYKLAALSPPQSAADEAAEPSGSKDSKSKNKPSKSTPKDD